MRAAALPASGPGRTPAARRADTVAGLGLVGPALGLLVALFLVPTLSIFAIATTDWQFGAPTLAFVGVDNFIALVADPTFRRALLNTLGFVVIVVPVTVALGLLIALLIESERSLRDFYRAVHFLPFMATLAATAVAWEALLHPTIGLVNQLLGALGAPTANWLRDEKTALPVLAAMAIWQNLGFAMVVFLAALKAVPQELYDAADIDGADSAFERLRAVTLPLIAPAAMFVVIAVAIRAFETFDTVLILTGGGPANSSELLLHLLYVESFDYLRTGYGAAITVIFLLIIVALTLAQARVMDRTARS